MKRWEWFVLGLCVGFDAGTALAQWIRKNEPLELQVQSWHGPAALAGLKPRGYG